MTTRPTAVYLRVRVAWWIYPYIHGLALIHLLTGLEPDWRKVSRWVKRAVSVQVDNGP